MKCRGCGKDTKDVLVEGLGWMHWTCEIERLKGLYEESEGIQQYFVELMAWLVEHSSLHLTPERKFEEEEKYEEIQQIIKDYKE